jgi:hypothetical protein
MATKYTIPIVFKSDKKGINDAESGLDKLGKTAANIGGAIAIGLAVAAAATVAFGFEAAKAAAEAEAITRGLENAAKNAGVFGDKAASIGKATTALDSHSKKLGELIGIDDEIINQIKTGWLAVPQLAALGTDGLNRLAEVVADTAAGTGKDVTAIGLAFQRIAGDTETAFSKLTRAGIVFTDEQKATFDSILATNGEMAAQQYLVEQLGQKYEGAAEAAANPFARLDVIFGNLQETIGSALLPAIETFVTKFSEWVSQNEGLIKTTMEDVGNAVMGVVDAFIAFTDWKSQNEELFNAIAISIGVITVALGLAALAVWAFNIALYANPIGLIVAAIIIGIGLVVAAIWILASNWDKVIESLSKAWDWVTWQLGTLWAGFANGFIDILNGMISGINLFLDALNAIAGTNFQISLIGKVKTPGQPMSTRTGSFSTGRTGDSLAGGGLKLAEGGIVLPRQGGTLATIGEAGQAEAVIPLDRLGSFGNGGNTYNINVNAGMGTDGAALGEQIVNAIRRYERTSGAVFARA